MTEGRSRGVPLEPERRRRREQAVESGAASAGLPSRAMRPNPIRADESVRREVLEVVRAWNDAFARNDVERYFEFVDPDVTVLTPTNPYRVEGLAQDREEFEFSLASGKTHVNLFQMMQPEVQLAGEAAVVTYFWRGSLGRSEATMVHFKETDVLVRRTGGWKLLHVHLSRAAP